jgi:hypothetical protein
MITEIFNNGITKGLQLSPINELTSLSICFDSVEARDSFCKQFPKYLKVTAGFLTSFDGYNTVRTPLASLHTMWVNKVTGDINEAGEKRMKKFYFAVQKELSK